MRHLILGCGYLGRRVATAWQEQGHEVCALTRSAERAADFHQQGWTAVVGDVTEPDRLRELPPVDSVLWAVGFDRTSGISQQDVYVGGLRNALAAMHGKFGRWISISSTSVYGQDDGTWVDERSPCEPLSASGQVCLDAETLLRNAVPSATVLRLSGIYGPKRLIGRTESLKAGTPLPLRPDAWLNLIHVDDAAAAVLACERQGRPGETWLVSDDRPILRHQFYELLCELVGAPPPSFDPGHAADGLNKRCSNRRVKQELGLTLQFPTLEQGLPNALELGT